MPNLKLLNALAETFVDVPPAAQLHVTMAAATLAGNPTLALRWGQILTEHTAPPEPEATPEIVKRSPAQRIGLNDPMNRAVVQIPLYREDGPTTTARITLTATQIDALAECAGIWTCPDDISHGTLNALIVHGLITGGSVVTDLGRKWLSGANLA